jgi:hypothetical protein
MKTAQWVHCQSSFIIFCHSEPLYCHIIHKYCKALNRSSFCFEFCVLSCLGGKMDYHFKHWKVKSSSIWYLGDTQKRYRWFCQSGLTHGSLRSKPFFGVLGSWRQKLQQNVSNYLLVEMVS